MVVSLKIQSGFNLKIIADENLALTDYYFADVADLEYHPGRKISREDVQDADALIVRSVTKVNEVLLANSVVSFVGSATIGTDHVDLEYLKSRNIPFANAPGCNAQAVAEYVVTAILTLRPQLIDAGTSFCLGIVGLGNVGKRLARLASRLNWRVIGCDPYVKLAGIENVSFGELLLQSNVVSLHVPLTKVGQHATYHLFDADAFAQLKIDTMLINSARGEVVSEEALLADLAHSNRQVVLDVFEHEPKISKNLLDQLAIATPHIAGYSLEGKARGTAMVHEAFCKHFGLAANKSFESQLPQVATIFDSEQPLTVQLNQLLPQIYNIYVDDQAVRNCMNADSWVEAAEFDRLRKEYPLRREWAAYGDQP